MMLLEAGFHVLDVAVAEERARARIDVGEVVIVDGICLRGDEQNCVWTERYCGCQTYHLFPH